jgi:hypothetical protein
LILAFIIFAPLLNTHFPSAHLGFFVDKIIIGTVFVGNYCLLICYVVAASLGLPSSCGQIRYSASLSSYFSYLSVLFHNCILLISFIWHCHCVILVIYSVRSVHKGAYN